MVKEGLIDTTQSVQLIEAKYDDAIEAAAGVIISSGYTKRNRNGSSLSFPSTMRDANGRKIYPEIGFRQNLTNFSGMQAAVSDTVSAKMKSHQIQVTWNRRTV